MVVELFHEESGTVIASITVPSGNSASLTGVFDLPEGDSTLCIRMYAAEYGGSGDYDGAGLQVIVGQTVEEPGCPNTGPSPNEVDTAATERGSRP
jgi:hypothetical protein